MPAEDGSGPGLCQEEIIPILGKNSDLFPLLEMLFPYTSSENPVLKSFKYISQISAFHGW